MGDLITIACGFTMVLGTPINAQVNPQEWGPSTNAREPQPSDLEQADVNAMDRPTAEELLKALQRRRSVAETILPAGATGDRGTPEHAALWPEGSVVVDRSGRLAKQGLWWTFVFDPADGEPPTKLLPGAGLEVMVRTATGARSPVNFIVSGEMTVFGGENYLLVRLAKRSVDTGQAAARLDEIDGKDETSVKEKSPQQKPAGETAAGDIVSADTSVDDVLAAMSRQQPSEEVIPLVVSPSENRLDRGATAVRTLIPDGSPLVHRPGRIIRDGPWWTFVFESDHPDHPEPPMKLLPNSSVELMLQLLKHEKGGLVFLVSGEVTVFEGENFLLPMVAMRRVDSDNLRR